MEKYKNEIERKFLIKNIIFDLMKYKSKIITQAYISLNPEIRIRKSNNHYFRTEKTFGAIERHEKEYIISKRDFEHNLERVISNIIKKERFIIPISNGLIAELDKYQSNLEGLVTVEVEFSNIIDAKRFIPPNWFGEEITYNEDYKNKNLSMLCKGEIKEGEINN